MIQWLPKVDSASVLIDGRLFRLYYKTTATIVAILTIIVGAFQFVGDPIDCAVDVIYATNSLSKTLDNYCWAQNVYYYRNNKITFNDVSNKFEPHFQNFKWIVCLLLFQIITFYLPHALWMFLEGNRIKNYILEIREDTVEDVQLLASILDEPHFRKENKVYLRKYLACSFLNIVFLIGQIWLAIIFLGKGFTSYGVDVLEFILHPSSFQYDPIASTFPKIVHYPTSRSLRTGTMDYSYVCTLPINFINENIFLFLWFWFAGLLILTALDTILWITTYFNPKLKASRLISLTRNGLMAKKFETKVEKLVSRRSIGDWFVLSLLGKNLKESTFKSLMMEISNLDGEDNKYGDIEMALNNSE